MQGRLIELGAVGDLDNAAEVHDGDTVGDVAHHRQVVGDKNVSEAKPLLQLHKQIDDLGLDRNVEGGDRLVADHQTGLQGQGAGDADALALPAGELVRIALGHIGQQADQAISCATRSR